MTSIYMQVIMLYIQPVPIARDIDMCTYIFIYPCFQQNTSTMTLQKNIIFEMIFHMSADYILSI